MNDRKLGVAALLLAALTAGCADDGPNANMATPAENTSGAAAEPETSLPIADGKLIVAFGDSLYAGYQLGATEGFAPALERALKAQGIAATVVNAGVSGETTAQGRARLAFTLDGQPRKPDLVILGLGANDMLRGLSPQEARANLDAMLTELDKRGIKTVLTGMIAAPNLGADYAAAFNPIFPDLAKKHGAALYPFFLDGVAGKRELLLADGMHPNPKGVGVIVEHVAPMIADAVK